MGFVRQGLNGCAAVVATMLLARSGAPDAGRPEPLPARQSETAAPFVARPERTLRHPDGPLQLRLASGNDVPSPWPNAWVYVPTRFDPEAELHVIVMFHGFHNCVASYASKGGLPCTRDGAMRPGYDLAGQMDRAESGAILVVPEVARDEASSDPGKLGEPGALAAFVRELLDDALAPYIGEHRSSDVARLALVASSGGYQALTPALERGGLPVTDVYLLDACYVYRSSPIGSFLFASSDAFAGPRPARRFGVLYSRGAGAFPTSDGMRREAEQWLDKDGLRELGHFTTKRAEPKEDEFEAPVFFVYSHLMHDAIVARYFWQVVRASGL